MVVEALSLKKLFALLCALLSLWAIPSAGEEQMPSEQPAATAVPFSEYTYAEGSSKPLAVKFLYPSHWENLPGRSTVCFREPEREGHISARMAISVKKLSKAANSDQMTTQLRDYVKAIVAQYDSYEVGTLSTETDFMGKTGYSTIYKATKDGQEIHGHTIMACVGTRIYAFHFSATQEDYAALNAAMQHIRDNIKSAK